MTDLQDQAPPEQDQAAGHELLERGRYAIEKMPDGSWFIHRAVPICDACQTCGCGEQAEPIQIPAMVASIMTMDPEKRQKMNPLALARSLMGGRNGSD